MTKKLIVLLILFMSVMVIYSQKRVNYKESYNYMRAIELYEDKEYDDALPFVDSVLSKHPKEAKFHYYKANMLYSKDEYDKALESVQQSLKYVSKKDSSDIEDIYLLRAAVYLQQKDTANAINDYLNCLKFNNVSIALVSLAEIYKEQGDFQKSNEYYQILRNRESIIFQLYNSYFTSEIANNYISLQDWDEVIKICTELIDQQDEDEDADVYYSRAKAYMGKSMWNEAASDLFTVLNNDDGEEHKDEIYKVKEPLYTILLSKLKIEKTKNPSSINNLLHISKLYKNHKQYDKAISTLKSYQEIDPEETCLYDTFAELYFEQGDFENALRYINKALENDSTDTACKSLKALIVLYLGDPYGSISLCDELIEEDPEQSIFYYLRGLNKYVLDDYEGVEEDYSIALTLEPENVYFLVGRGNAYSNLGLIDRAKYDYNQVIEIEKKKGISSSTSYAYLELGDKERAIEIIDSLLTQHQDSASLYYNAACIYSRAQNKEKALQLLEKAFQLGHNHFYFIRNDHDLDFINNSTEFLSLVDKYEKELRSTFTCEEEQIEDNVEYEYRTAEIPFTVEQGGLLKMKCTINGLPLDFLLDTGASLVMLSATEYLFMFKNNYLTAKDIRGSAYSLIADNSKVEVSEINLRKVDFGGFTLENVKASVMPNISSSLLLGQSVLNKAGKVEIDYENKILKITYKVKK